MASELRPCPFCGGEAILYASPEGGICVMCWKCGAKTSIRSDHLGFSKPTNATKSVIEDWNRRATDDE